MADSKTERQLNLLFLLLNTPAPIEREEIRRRIPGYFDKSDEAFERMFERDKEDLRELGIPVETVSVDTFHEDVFGYRLRQSDWLLPEIVLTAPERTLLNLASAAWSQAQLGSAFNAAVQRLSEKFEVQPSFEFELARQGDYLDSILKAQAAGKCVTFTYLSKASGQTSDRVVAPWRIFLSQGSSYLIGFDQDKGEQRVFKLARVIGPISQSDEDAIELAPADLSADQIVANWRAHNSQEIEVKLQVATKQAGELRLIANEIKYGEDFDYLSITISSEENLVNAIARNCDVVQVIEPLELRDQVNKVLSQVKVS